jgi:hypothetical protein
MSYEPSTGWTRLTGRQVERYARRVDGLSDDLDERLDVSGLAHYWDTHGNLHARCMPGELWVLLNGEQSRFDDPDPTEPVDQQWISVTDLGAVFDPAAPPSTVLKMLREEGLLERFAGKDRPTPQADGLYMERPASPVAGRDLKPGAVQRLWSYDVLVKLRARRVATADNDPHKSPPALRALVVKFPAACDRCRLEIVAGSEAYWDSAVKAIRCTQCATAAAAGTGQR